MADRYLSRVLAGMERLFKFPSAQKGAPSDVELDLPIQTVVDVGGIATMGAGEGRQNGFWIWNFGVAHTIVGSITITPDPFNPYTNANGYPALVDARDQSIWFYDLWGNSDDLSDVATVVVSHLQGSRAVGPSTGTGGPQTRKVLFYSTTGTDEILMESMTYRIRPQYPFRSLRNEGGGGVDSYIRMKSTADNVGTVVNTVQMLLWLGPKGITPPLFGK